VIPPFQFIDGANMHAVRAEHFHVFLDHHRCDYLRLH
jgi:hypothetical protein